MAATRLPGKVLLPLAGAPALERLIERVRRSQRVDEVVVATTVAPADVVIVDLCGRIGCRVAHASSFIAASESTNDRCAQIANTQIAMARLSTVSSMVSRVQE